MGNKCTYSLVHTVLTILDYEIQHTKCNLIKERIDKVGVIKIVINIFLTYMWFCKFFSKNQKINQKIILFKFISGISILIYESNTKTLDPSPVNQNYDLKDNEIFDSIVIGSGPGGSIAALKMLQNKENVLIIESGKYFKPGMIEHHSYKQSKLQFVNEGMNFCYGNIPMLFAEGGTFGGGSEVNSGLYFKLTEPYRDKLLKKANITEDEWIKKEQHIEKMLSVQDSPKLNKQLTQSALVKGSNIEGITCEEVPRWRKYLPIEEHQGMQVTYLEKARDLGLKILSETHVEKLVRNDDFVLVKVTKNESTKYLKAKKVVVSAGTLETPNLLKKSYLLKDSIKFDFHPMTRCVVDYGNYINDGDLFPPYQAWTTDLKHKFGYAVSTYPYVKATLASLGYFNKDINAENFACYFSSTVLEKSKGRIFYLRGKAYPFIYIKKYDRDKITEGFSKLKKILKNAEVKQLWPEKSLSPMTTVHIFGSLPINSNKDIGKNGELLVDPRIKICDASLLPTAPWGNPQAVIMALNEILIERWLKTFG
jgi:hypothetical protein